MVGGSSQAHRSLNSVIASVALFVLSIDHPPSRSRYNRERCRPTDLLAAGTFTATDGQTLSAFSKFKVIAAGY